MSNSGKGQAANAIENVLTATLIPYARNARTHSDSQVAQIAGSIQEFGFNNPVLIDAENGIIAGHGRVMAANLLKLERVPCIRLAHLSDAQKRAFILADNRIALNSGWDTEMLANELSDLHADEIDLGLTGFDADELARLLGMTEEVDKEDAYDGMPAFVNEATKDVSLIVYFASPEDKEQFSRQVQQAVTTDTKFVWFPASARPQRQGVNTLVAE